MRKTHPLFIVLFLVFATGMSSCNNYGEKNKVEGTKGEVYYKDGTTETQAKNLGEFLKKAGFLTNEKAASVQITKENGEYLVRFVYDKDYFEKTEGLEKVFKQYGTKISKEIFNGEKVNIALANNQFKDYKKIPFDEALASKPEDEGAGETFSKDDYDHDKAGDVSFYWKGISDEESKTIADYIVKNGAFVGGTAEIYITKEGDRFMLRFPVKEEYRDNPATINQVAKVSKEIKENVFANNPYTFQMTDENLKAVKSFEY